MNIHCRYDELVDPHSLKPHKKNRNQHSKEQIERLAKILEYQGQRAPVVISRLSGCIVKGHGTTEAVKELGAEKIAVVYQDFPDADAEYSFMTSDNAIAEWAELDLSGINADLADLGPDFDIDLLGLKDFVLEPAEKFEPQSDEDSIPEHVEPKTKLGDIYQLGRHRLMCGDSTDILQVEKLMNGEKADMVFTDPPFPNNSGIMHEMIEGIEEAFSAASTFTLGDQLWFWDNLAFPPFIGTIVSKYIWHKTNGWQAGHFETIYRYGTGDRKEQLVYSVPNVGVEMRRSAIGHHPTPKPPKLIQEIFETLKAPTKILDLFGGSGSTLIACEKTNRKCFMMEIDPHYCDVIVARWEKYTGQKAELLTHSQEAANG